MPYTLSADVDERPVSIVGAGTLGRRLALVYAAGGSDVRIFDLSAEQREAARDYVEEHVTQTQQSLGLHPPDADGSRSPTASCRKLSLVAGW
jgi:3-hydroxybutyryl-CoA dehydrogenase